MKVLVARVVPIFFLAFVSCHRVDEFPIGGITNRCQITDASSPEVGLVAMGGGFHKTFYPNGQVETVTTRLFQFFAHVDSIVYTFTYQDNKALVSASLRPYVQGAILGLEPADSLFASSETEPKTYSFEVIVNPRTGFAESAGDTKFNYENGKLISHTKDGVDYPAQYDDKGNITRKSGESVDVLYEYDAKKTALLQQYYTTGYAVNEMYNLMEILGWIPVAPKNLCISYMVGDPNVYTYATYQFTNHEIDGNGLLRSFKSPEIMTNQISCTPVKAP